MLHVIYAFAFFSFGSLLKLQAPGRNFCFAHCCIPNAYNRFLRYIRTSINLNKEGKSEIEKGLEGKRSEERKREVDSCFQPRVT